MSILELVAKTVSKAPRILIYGVPGIGKSSLAAQFDTPLFLSTEEVALPGINSLPISESFGQFWGYIESLLNEPELPFKTLVIDSITRLDALIIDYILKNEVQVSTKKALTLASACGGYGAGYERAAAVHRNLKCYFNKFQDKGITVVFIAHSTTKTHKAPDADDYDIYTIQANHDKTRAVYIDDCDAVLFCREKSVISETDTGRHIVKSLNQRIVMTSINPVNVSKNRYSMPDELPMKFEELAKYIPFYNNKRDNNGE